MKRISPVVVGLVVSALLFSTTYLTAQLIPTTGNGNQVNNPSFEQHDAIPADSVVNFTAIPGWDSDAGVIRLHSGSDGGISAHSGDSKLELDTGSNSDIHQTLTTATGQRYSLGLFYAPQVTSPAGTDTNDVTLSWNGSLLDTLSGDRNYWQHRHYDIAAENDTSILRLEGAGTSDGQGGFIDDIDLEAVPYTTFNLVENGSFEQYGALNHGDWGTFASIPGWDADTGSVEIQTNGIGGQFSYEGKANLEADADSNSSVYQDVSTDPSQHYELSLRYSPRVTSPAGTDTNNVEVWWDGVKLTTLGGDRHGWQRHVFDVTAATALTRLMLVGTGTDDSYGGLIDDVRLYGTCRAGANLIVNGSFEQHDALNHGQWGTFASIPGWNADVGDIEIQHYTSNVPMADEGIAKLEPDADFNSTITQIIPTQAGKTYSLQWAYSPRVNSPGTHTNDIEVWWDNTLLTTLTGDQQGWQHFHMSVTASGASTPLTFKAVGDSDSYGGLIDDVRLYDVHLPPAIISDAPTMGQVNGTYSYQVQTDQPPDVVPHYELVQGPAGMTLNAGGTLSWVPDQTGDFDVTIKVSNDCGGSATQSFTITVINANQPPVITSTPVTSGDTGITYVYDVQASDPDGDALTYQLTVAPPGMTIDPATGLIQWLPAAKGSYLVQVDVSDGKGGVASQAFGITIPNHPPQITSTPVTTAVVGTPYTYTVQADDPDGDTLTFSLLSLPLPGLTLDPATGTLSWIPPAVGPLDVVVQVSDGGTDSQSFTINVTAANQAPVITSTPVTTAIVNSPYAYTVTATDADGDTLNYALTAAPTGMTIDPASGQIGWTPAATGDVTVSVVVSDGNGGSATQSYTLSVQELVIPPDPSTVAPPLDPTGVTAMLDATSFLYSGASASQVGVAAGTIQAKRVTVIRGLVKDRNNAPLSGVNISINNHAEYGQTLSRADGMFDMAANGGGTLIINYRKAGYLPVQRKVDTPWRDFVSVEDVVMIPVDPQVTSVDLTSTQAFQIAQGSVQTDSDGSRQATVLIPQGTTATMVMPDGTTQPLTSLDIRATEYTVGDNGPQTMPGELPETSAYTYAVNLSVDQAQAAGAKSVEFSQPLPVYIDNFLNFPVGGGVPLGYYDFDQGSWIPADNGRIIEIVSINAQGLAEIDIDGDGVADTAQDLAALGITDAERTQLAQTYAAGKTLWRVAITHFTPWDCNWPYGPPNDAQLPPNESPETDDKNKPDPEDSDDCKGCSIEPQSQTLGESVPLVGSSGSIHYRSDRVPGAKTGNTLNIPISGATVPASLEGITLSIDIAGQHFVQSYPAAPNQTVSYLWNGLDAYGREVTAKTRAHITVDYIYKLVYFSTTPARDRSFGRFPDSSFIGTRGNRTSKLRRAWDVTVYPALNVINEAAGLGGWSLDGHNAYDPIGQTLYLGNGDKRTAFGVDVMLTKAGNGIEGFTGDGGPAVQARLDQPSDVAVGPDGSLYIADTLNDRIRKVDPDGIVTTVAGSGNGGFTGDGGPAVNAWLSTPLGVFVDADGSIYIADSGNNRIRKVTPDGIIHTVAGNGDLGFSGDDGPAVDATLYQPTDVVVDPDGNIYISDRQNQRIRLVTPDGIISTYAGIGTQSFSGDGGPATQAAINRPQHLALDRQGNLYFASINNRRIRMITPSGIISTVAGNGSSTASGDGDDATLAGMAPEGVTVTPDGRMYIADTSNNTIRLVDQNGIITTIAGNGNGSYSGDKGPALDASLFFPESVAVDPDGVVYVADALNHTIRQISRPFPAIAGNEIAVPSGTGRQLYVFNGEGKHLRTVDTVSGNVIFSFAYDANGHLSSITDRDGDVTTIERNAGGDPTAIMTPDGQSTGLALDTNGFLASVTNPNGEAQNFQYNGEGLIMSHTDPRSSVNTFMYDATGRLIQDIDPVTGGWTLDRTTAADGYAVSMTSGEGRVTTFAVDRLATGERRLTSTAPDGTNTVKLFGLDNSETTTLPDGTQVFVKNGADPRFGFSSPVPRQVVTTTPGGLQQTISSSRSAVLADPANLLSHTTLTDSVTVNGRTSQSVYTTDFKTWNSTSAENRQVGRVLDAKGRVIQTSIGGLAAASNSYTPEGRPATITQGSGADARLTQFSYYGTGSAKGFLQSITDAENQQVSFEYDAAGRITKETLPDLREILFSYDANGNVTSITPPGRPAHTFNYNAVDQESDYTAPAVAGVAGSTTLRTYNKDKQLELITLPDGKTIDFVNNAATGQVSSIIIPRGTYAYSYDGASGNLNQITAPDGGTLAFSYDGSLPLSSTWAGDVNGSVSQTYNNDFVITQQQVNGANAISYGYDNDLLLIQAGDLTLTRSTQNSLITGTTLTEGTNTVTTSRGYNAFAEITSDAADYNGTGLYSVSYTRDKIGRITDKTETVGGVTTTYAYIYDAAGRLTEVQTDGVTSATYAYDANSNRTQVNGVLLGTYDDQDRLTQYGDNQYTYTDNGELLTKTNTVAGETSQYNYDVLGNLVSVTLPDTSQIDYVVDGQNRRIGKKVNGSLVQGFLYSNQRDPVAELDGSGAVVSRFIYASKLNVPDYMIKGGVIYRIISDDLGSPRLVINMTDGSVVQRMDYDVFGNVIADTNPGFQPFGFAGGLYDRDTGLVRFGARDYDPETGRWTGKDTIGFQGGATNLYGYVLNDPVNFVDPSGQFINLGLAGIGALIGAGFGAIDAAIKGESITKGAIEGGLIGLTAGFTFGGSLLAEIGGAAAVSAGAEALRQFAEGECFNGGKIAAAGLLGALGANVAALADSRSAINAIERTHQFNPGSQITEAGHTVIASATEGAGHTAVAAAEAGASGP